MAVDMFLKIEGIDGESADSKHKGEIEVQSYSWGISQQSAGGRTGAAAASKADFHDFSITKSIDKSSPKLALSCATGEHLKSIRLELRRAGGEQTPYMEYKFSDVIITNYRPAGHNGGGDSLPMEEVSFAYSKAEWKYFQTDSKTGKATGNVAAGYNLAENKKV
jgi:type VI secretion system secreted protein Hcp